MEIITTNELEEEQFFQNYPQYNLSTACFNFAEVMNQHIDQWIWNPYKIQCFVKEINDQTSHLLTDLGYEEINIAHHDVPLHCQVINYIMVLLCRTRQCIL